MHNEDKDPGATDRRERPQPGSAEGPGQPNKLQQGPSTSRERPNNGSAEDPKQPKKLQQGLPQLQPHPLESYESDPSKVGLLMMTFQPRQCLGEDQEKKEEDSPSFGRCRPLS